MEIELPKGKQPEPDMDLLVSLLIELIQKKCKIPLVSDFNDTSLLALVLFYKHLWISHHIPEIRYFQDSPNDFPHVDKFIQNLLFLYLETDPGSWMRHHLRETELDPKHLVFCTFFESLCKQCIGEEITKEIGIDVFNVLFVNTTGKVDDLPEKIRELVTSLLMGEKPQKQSKAISKDTKSPVELVSITESLEGLSLK